MGTIKTTNIEPIADNGTVTLGGSGDTFTVPSGVTVNMSNATQTGVGGTNTPYFYGELASNQTITRATFAKVTGLTNNELDSNSAFDGTTFTVPSAGKYYIEGVVTGDYQSIGQDGENTVALIYKNGSGIKSAKWQNSSATGQTGREITVTASGIFNLSASDTIELYTYLLDSSGGNAFAQSSRTSLMGYKIIE